MFTPTPVSQLRMGLHPPTPVHQLPTPGGGGGGRNVRVYVRCRPLLPKEEDDDSTFAISLIPDTNQVCVESGGGGLFQYAGVLGPNQGQSEVFDQCVSPLVSRVRSQGGNCTVLAYGQTGSGKTHTMGTQPTNSQEEEGILQRSIRALLKQSDPVAVDPTASDITESLKKKDPLESMVERRVAISMLEVYNETVYDLLTPTRKSLNTKSTVGGGLNVVGYVEKEVESVEEGMTVLERGSAARSTTTTTANNHSSRSHALIYLTYTSGLNKGWLRLVDLAGSESAGRMGGSSSTFNEGININKSLLTLGKVLAALSTSANGYIPYRECVLTRLLKDCVGGAAQTVMVACVTPAASSLPQTLTTLRYAQQATHIKQRAIPPSTVKKSAVKRGRGPDITATPGTLKKRRMASTSNDNNSGVKPGHNTTISTPGHRPPARQKLIPSLNNTLDTPSWRSGGEKNLMPPPRLPVFEDNSPSSLSCVSAVPYDDHLDNTAATVSYSPLVERVTSCLERTMQSHMERVEERMAESFMSLITTGRQKNNTRAKKRPNGRHLSRCSTPTEDENKNDSTETGSGFLKPSAPAPPRRSGRLSTKNAGGMDSSSDTSEDDLLGTSFMKAILGGRKMRNVMKKVVAEMLSDTQKDSDVSAAKKRGGTGGRALADVTNIVPRKSSGCTPLVDSLPANNGTIRRSLFGSRPLQPLIDSQVAPRKSLFGGDKSAADLPITSTAVFEGRAVRRSTRFSNRLSHHAVVTRNLSSADDLTPSFDSKAALHPDEPSPVSPASLSFLHQTTVLYTNDGSPDLRSNNLQSKNNLDTLVKSVKEDHSMDFDTTTLKHTNINETVNLNITTALLDKENRDIKCEAGNRDLYKNTDTTYFVASDTKLKSANDATGTTLPQDKLITPIDPNMTFSFLYQNNPKPGNVGETRRRSTRVCAVAATARNHKLLTEQSPVVRRRSRARTANTSKILNTTQAGASKVILSPTLNQDYSQNILRVLSQGSLRELQKLPAIGPKTAMILMRSRQLYGELKSIEAMKEVTGLQKTFYARFVKVHMLDL